MKNKDDKFTAVYIRVSTAQQSHQSQIPDLKRYVKLHHKQLGRVRILTETGTGTTMDRPKWNKIYKAILKHRITNLIVWRLDRLGRTASGLTKLFEELNLHRCNLISLTENIDLSTPAGRMVANIIASSTAYETELRAERVLAGQAAAKAKGKTWGGSKKGSLYKITRQQCRLIVDLKAKGKGATDISRSVGTSVMNVYRILKRVADGDIVLA